MTPTALLISVVTVGLLAMASPAMLQDRLLYYPGRADVAEVVSGELRAWPAPDDFRGLVAQPAGAARGTAIVFHGNAGHAGHRTHYAHTLTRLGLRVILAEYPGYGPRDGELGERSMVDDAAASIALAHRRYGAPLLVVGESLGAGVAAAAVARRRDETAALLLLTPWDRLEHVAAAHYPWLPVHWLLNDRYESDRHLASFDRPVLVLVAEDDRIVPARFGIALHEGLAAPKRLDVRKGVGHNGWLQGLDDEWWREAIRFLLG